MASTDAGALRLSSTAFAALLRIALLMGANHVAARLAFNNGVDVATAIAVRSAATAAGGAVVGNSAIMNIEPIFALVLAWAVLGQHIAAR